MNYKPPFALGNGHVQTIYPSVFRKIDDSFLRRIKIDTEDGDIIVLDKGYASLSDTDSVQTKKSDKVVIISHGLEGHSRRPYVLGMAKALMQEGWDVYAWNFRSCGGEMNRKLRFYHSGATDDLSTVIEHGISDGYKKIGLVGFSMGGNLSLVYLGQRKQAVRKEVCGAIVFSVPCDLAACAESLAKPSNGIYMKRFLKDLRQKIMDKKRLFPSDLNILGLDQIKNFREFDDRYTAPIHGFKDADDYWSQCSSRHYIEDIRVPTVIVNAANDPFLAPSCYPHTEVDKNPMVSLETPASGGHVGFVSLNPKNMYWSERRAVKFFSEIT